MTFGAHVDNAIRGIANSGIRIRTDVSSTLFISRPEDYDGGELVVEDTYGSHTVKLPAGDMIVNPATSLHHVTPARLAHRVVLLDTEHDPGRKQALLALRYGHGDHQVAARSPGSRVAGRTDVGVSQFAPAVG